MSKVVVKICCERTFMIESTDARKHVKFSGIFGTYFAGTASSKLVAMANNGISFTKQLSGSGELR